MLDQSLEITAVTAEQPRARGAARLSVRLRDGATRIAGLRQEGSLKLLFPHGAGASMEAVFLNTAGGLTGGDRMTLSASVGTGAALRVSSQAAERAYRAREGFAQVELDLSVAEAGRIDWLPQETILFDGASLRRRMRVELAAGARALLVEPLILGRAAMGEEVREASFRDRWEVRRDGRLVFADALRLEGDLAGGMDRRAVGGGARAAATVLLAAPEADSLLAPVRAALGATGGASVVGEGLLFARVLAPGGFALRRLLIPVLEQLGGCALPKVWRL